MGPNVSARLTRHGFFPRGGGRIEVDITPGKLTPIDCINRGALRSVSATALFADLLSDVASREIATARKLLSDWPEDAFAVRQLPDEQGPGNALLLEAVFDHAIEVVTGFGKLGVSAAGFLASDAFAGPYLADQLLPFALAGGGSFTTVEPSQHSRTAADVVEGFTGQRWTFEQQPGGSHLVRRE